MQRMRAARRTERHCRWRKQRRMKGLTTPVGDLFRAEYLRYEAQIKAIDVGAGGQKKQGFVVAYNVPMESFAAN